ncbi:NUDIX hydrolase family protein [Dictyostelium discoideum AX4]|uniref:NUDIX hydrolase family protein n=1 Tax=Dictyostelium discoideum TaxID=44689 RepID=Q54FR0_DICDI|nr:NUDIX hydrolase family protein [Dictyostelium discoideum AX4]EAL62095.1 NUDIX hydrolase family protein [Dictyostelium discoideum AX4]|eukprot:XP_635597.1 NUDIX hydrolase family protein [Dictyostelium discoideum AX4]
MNEAKYRSCVGALIFNQNNQVLICKRSSKKKTAVGKWQFPQGGVEVEKNEDYYVAVQREIKEEVGLEPSIDTLKYVSKLQNPLSYIYEDSPKSRSGGHIGQMIHWYLFYLPNDLIKTVNLNVEEEPEFEECKWFGFEEFINNNEMIVPFKKDMLHSLFLESQPIINHYLESVIDSSPPKQLSQ